VTLALLFSPQGSQAIGMGRDLADRSPAARACFDEADAVLGWSVSSTSWEGPEARLNDTRQTQPCLFTTSLAALAALREAASRAGVELMALRAAGHSVGEYAALVASGVLAFADGLRLVALRGQFMADARVAGGMAAVMGLDRERVAAVVAETAPGELVVANDNAPGQVVISGTLSGIAAVEPVLQEAGARRVIPLKVSGPFHSPLMEPVGVALATAFEDVGWHDASPPVVSNVTAEPVADAAVIRSLLARQVSSPVEWVASVRRMVADGVDTFVECGPGNALAGMVRRIAPGVRTFGVSDGASLAAAIGGIAQPGAATSEVSA
jgi:[acyl-carrier-protein] S-malonyltransferase